MNILVVSRNIFPVNSPRSFRTTELVKEFCMQGHNVTLYIVKEHEEQDRIAKEFGFIIKDLGPLKLKDISTNYKSKYISLILRGMRRLLLLLFEFPSIELMFKVKNALKKENNYDLLVSVAVPHSIHWGVAWVRSKKHPIAKIWVADCGDPFMGDKLDSFKKLFYFEYFEKWFGRKTDYISVPSTDHISYYFPEFKTKIRVIPQGFKFENQNIYKGEIKNPVPTFAFAGVFVQGKREPDSFLKYLSTLIADFKFVVFSPNVQFLIPFKEKLGKKLDIRGFIPREDLLYELSKMDFLLHIEFHSFVKSNSPSKFADYAIANRPVIALNMEHIDKEKFVAFLNKDYSQQMDLSDADKYRIENVTQKFLDLTNE